MMVLLRPSPMIARCPQSKTNRRPLFSAMSLLMGSRTSARGRFLARFIGPPCGVGFGDGKSG